MDHPRTSLGFPGKETTSLPDQNFFDNSAERNRDALQQADWLWQRQKVRKSYFLNIFVLFLGVVSLGLTLIPSALTWNSFRLLSKNNADVDPRFKVLEQRVSLLEAKGSATVTVHPDGAIEKDVSKLQTEMQDLRSALGDDPIKSLSVPMLRRDIDSLKDSARNDLAAIRQEFQRTFDIAKWIVGLIAASNIGLGVLGLLQNRADIKKQVADLVVTCLQR